MTSVRVGNNDREEDGVEAQGEEEEEEEEGEEDGDDAENDEEEGGEDDEDDEDDEDEQEDTTDVIAKAASHGKRRQSGKVAVAAPPSSALIAVRARPRKPEDVQDPSSPGAGLRITQQKRLGRAWGGGEGEDASDGGGGGPRIDLAHLAFVQEDFSRRTDAVAQLRARMAAKSRPGFELRMQRRWDCASVARLVARRHLAWLPCVAVSMTDAVWDGDILQVHALLLRQPDAVNARDPRTGQRAVNLAIQQQHEPIVRLLLDRGADVNEPDADADAGGAGLAPLHNALIMGNKALFRRLLKAGADARQPDAEGFTPLLWAAMRGYLEVAAQLVEAHGADVNAQDALGWTPLHVACFKGYADLVDYLLLERKARADLEDANGFTPFTFARIAEHRDILRRLDEHAAAEARRRLARQRDAEAKAARRTRGRRRAATKQTQQAPSKRLFVTSSS